jgi:hypothetical protein
MLYFILLWTMQKSEEQRAKSGGQTAESEDSAAGYEPGAKSSYSRIPLYASLIFIAHPVQTQAVTYIVSRSSVLATFFYLLTFVFLLRLSGLRLYAIYRRCFFFSLSRHGIKAGSGYLARDADSLRLLFSFRRKIGWSEKTFQGPLGDFRIVTGCILSQPVNSSDVYVL